MTTIPTVVVHGGAGTYASIIHDHQRKADIENGTHRAMSNLRNAKREIAKR